MRNKRHLVRLRNRLDVFGAHNVNVNAIHQASLSLNDRIAHCVSQRVGTMWFCYGLAVLMMGWALLQWVLGDVAFDHYPYPFLFFVLGGIMQSLLMPLIMVAQNQDTRHAELRAELDYHVNQESFQQLKVILSNLTTQTQLIQQQDAKIAQLLSKPEKTVKTTHKVKNGNVAQPLQDEVK